MYKSLTSNMMSYCHGNRTLRNRLIDYPPTYLPVGELYLVKVNPTKGRVFPEDSPRSLERKS